MPENFNFKAGVGAHDNFDEFVKEKAARHEVKTNQEQQEKLKKFNEISEHMIVSFKDVQGKLVSGWIVKGKNPENLTLSLCANDSSDPYNYGNPSVSIDQIQDYFAPQSGEGFQ